MTPARGAAALAAAVLLLVAATSCASNGNEPAANGSPSPSPAVATTATSSAKPSATPTSETDVASTAASAIVRKYYATVDKLSQRSDVPLRELSTVAASVQLSAQRTLLRSQRAKGDRQTGDTKIAKLEVQSVNLDNSDPKAGKVPTVQVDVCWDVSSVDVVDANRQTIISPSRRDTGWTRLTVANYRYAADPTGGWRVATGQDLKRRPCAAS